MSALVDVCVLVAAHRRDHPHHAASLGLLDGALGEGFLWCGHTRNGFLRLVTHEAIFPSPTPMTVALSAWSAWELRPQSQAVPDSRAAGERFARLCRDLQASGNRVYDLYLAALAMQQRAELISLDSGFGHIPGLRWRSPLG